jgi:hypothetical protein
MVAPKRGHARMKIKLVITAFCASLLLAIVACGSLTEIDSSPMKHISGEYYLSSTVDFMYVCKTQGPGCGAILYDVRDVDWNADFIVTKAWNLREAGKGETGRYVWHIIDVHTGQLYGPLSFDDYLQQRDQLSVSPDIASLTPEDADFVVIRRRYNEP